jgi:two-component system, cell cycle sensor histidine kinase and response regulator CckA
VDIDHIQADEKLLGSGLYLRRLMSSKIIGIAVWNRDLVITEANDAFLTMLERNPGDLAGLRIEDLAAPESRDEVARAFAEIGERGSCDAFECEHLTARGSRIRLQLSGSLLADGSGLLLALEVGEHRKLQEKLRQTAKLESLGILAGGIAHDFNNLLTGILGNATLALESAASDSAASDLLRAVVQAGERAGALAHQMLAYSGRGEFRLESVDLSALVLETLSLIGSALGRATRLNLMTSPGLPLVDADASQLQQIVMNLAINAAEAADNKGEVSVLTGIAELDGKRHENDIVSGSAPPAGRYVFLEVRDSGKGMDTNTLQRIFDPFFTTKATGRGLGLAAVLGIVRSHKGVIRVTSAPGDGTTFTVYLPASHKIKRGDGPWMASAVRGDGIVLVVDDEEYVRETVRRTLEAGGYTVVCAAGGSEAMQLFQSLGSQIQLAIVDLTMPGEGGDEVVRRLRHHDPELKVIATSGYAEEEVKAKFVNLMDAFLPKPYRADRLREIVGSVITA